MDTEIRNKFFTKYFVQNKKRNSRFLFSNDTFERDSYSAKTSHPDSHPHSTLACNLPHFTRTEFGGIVDVSSSYQVLGKQTQHVHARTRFDVIVDTSPSYF